MAPLTRRAAPGLALIACALAGCASLPDPCPRWTSTTRGLTATRVAGTARWPDDFLRALRGSPPGRAFLDRLAARAGGSAEVAVEILGSELEREVSALSGSLVDRSDCRLAAAAAELRSAPGRVSGNDRFLVMLLIDGWTRRVVGAASGPRGPEPLSARVRAAGPVPPAANPWLAGNFPIYYHRAERVLRRLQGT